MHNLRENLGKVTVERDGLKKELEAKTLDIQEKLRTITQVKKLGRRYKTQYEELKVEHDKASIFFFHSDHFSFIGQTITNNQGPSTGHPRKLLRDQFAWLR